MRASPYSLLLATTLSAFGTGCTVDPTDEGTFKLHPRMPFTSAPELIAQDEPYAGEPVLVHVEHGNVQVVGKANAKTITVRAGTITWADNAADARAMRAAILAKLTVTREDGKFVVRCAEPDANVGSALKDASQCNVRVEVPAPEGAVHDVRAYAEDGFTYLARLASGPSTRIVATGIEIEAFLLRGNVSLHAGWLDAEVEPIAGGTVDVVSTTEDWYEIPSLRQVPKREARDGSARYGATLRLPANFRAHRVDLYSAGAAVEAFAFPDVVSGAPRGPVEPSAAALVSVRANQGNATLLPIGSSVTVMRQDEFGRDDREPWAQ